MTRKLKAAILLLLFAIALAAAFFGYRRKLAGSREVLAGKGFTADRQSAAIPGGRLL